MAIFPPRTAALAVLLLTVATVGATVAPAATAQQPTPAASPASTGLVGPIWLLVGYREGESLTPVLPGLTADAILWAGNISGSAGCGRYQAPYQLEDQDLTISSPRVGETACDPDALALQQVFLASLTAVTAWSIAGSELLLLDAGGVELLRFTSAVVPEELTVASWRLARVVGSGGVLEAVRAGSAPRADFLPGGRVVGDTGCGPFLGSYRVTEGRLSISGLATRQTDCAPELAAQAEAVIAALSSAASFGVTPAGVSLLSSAGDPLAAWIPAPPDAGSLWTPTQILDAAGEVIVEPSLLETAVLALDGQLASGRTNCRAWQAAYRRSGLALTIDPVTVAKGPCKPAAVQRSFIAALGSVASFAMRGEHLELLDAGGRAVMRLVPQPPLTDTHWLLTGIDSTAPESPPRIVKPTTKTPPSATFGASDGLVAGKTGCNDYDADFFTVGMSIVITDALATSRRCKGAAKRQEDLFLRRLKEVNAFVVLRGGLQLLAGDRVLLTFESDAG